MVTTCHNSHVTSNKMHEFACQSITLLESLDFPAETSENSAGNTFPADFAKDLPSWVIVS